MDNRNLGSADPSYSSNSTTSPWFPVGQGLAGEGVLAVTGCGRDARAPRRRSRRSRAERRRLMRWGVAPGRQAGEPIFFHFPCKSRGEGEALPHRLDRGLRPGLADFPLQGGVILRPAQGSLPHCLAGCKPCFRFMVSRMFVVCARVRRRGRKRRQVPDAGGTPALPGGAVRLRGRARDMPQPSWGWPDGAAC